jgi:hypothetical protein
LFTKLSNKFTKLNNKIETIFLDPNSQTIYELPENEKVNLVLSPSLYWVKKVAIPVKYTREARKLVPSIFENIIPEGDFNYTLYKKGEYYFIFAYEDETIIEAAKKVGIKRSNIEYIYFAQSEMQNTIGAIKINEKQSLYVKNDIVVLVPCCWIEEISELDIKNLISLSKHRVRLKRYSYKYTGNSSHYKLIAATFVLLVMMIVQYQITTNKTEEIFKLKERLFSDNNLKPTMLQNRSMLSKYKNIYTKQTNIRQYLSYILSINLMGAEKMSDLSLRDKMLQAIFINASKETELRINKTLNKKNISFKTEFKNDKVFLRIFL